MKRTGQSAKMPQLTLDSGAPRGAVAEIFIEQPVVHAVGMLAEVSRLGCFVRTRVPIPDKAKVKLKVINGESVVEIRGEVAYLVPWKGVGITFAEARPEFEAADDEVQPRVERN